MLTAWKWTAVAVGLAALAAAPTDKVTKESVTSGGQPRTYYLYVPSSAVGAPAPLLVLLHGSGRTGDVLVESWKELAKKQGIVLAGPDASNPSQWRIQQDGPDFLRDVVEAVAQSHQIDRRRVYLFGHSAGAVFSLYMGILESRYFAAVALSAGAFRNPAEFTTLSLATRKIPFWVFIGTRDQFFPMADAHKTRDAFAAAGFPFQLIEREGHDHNYYARADEINAAAWKFLSPLKLDADPVYEPRVIR